MTRTEKYLAGLTGDYTGPLPDPKSREDHYLKNLNGGDGQNLPEPIAQEDYYLAHLNGVYDGELPNPDTRVERYLAYLTGTYTGELPNPISREDHYLHKICLARNPDDPPVEVYETTFSKLDEPPREELMGCIWDTDPFDRDPANDPSWGAGILPPFLIRIRHYAAVKFCRVEAKIGTFDAGVGEGVSADEPDDGPSVVREWGPILIDQLFNYNLPVPAEEIWERVLPNVEVGVDKKGLLRIRIPNAYDGLHIHESNVHATLSYRTA